MFWPWLGCYGQPFAAKETWLKQAGGGPNTSQRTSRWQTRLLVILVPRFLLLNQICTFSPNSFPLPWWTSWCLGNQGFPCEARFSQRWRQKRAGQTWNIYPGYLKFIFVGRMSEQKILFEYFLWFEPRHEKTCLCHIQTTKAHNNLGILTIWSAPLLFTD